MRFLPTCTVSEIKYNKNRLVPCLQVYLQKGSGLDTLPFEIVGSRKDFGFFYEIDGKFICPTELANCIGYVLVDLINWYVSRFISVEDRADMFNDAVILSDSIIASNINDGRYNPYELYFNFFSVALDSKHYPVNQNDFN